MTPTLARPVLILALLAASGCEGGASDATVQPTARPAAADAGGVDVGDDFPEAPGLSGAGAVGQTVYVPVYSHIYFQDGQREVDLAVTLSVRNTDPERSVSVAAIRYHDSAGRLVRTYEGATLAPLASRAYVVDEDDRTGGVGANFVVQWRAEGAVSPPVVEAVMISTVNSQGISFVSRGRVIRPVEEAR